MIKGYGPLNVGYLNILNKYKDALLNRLMNVQNFSLCKVLICTHNVSRSVWSCREHPAGNFGCSDT